MTKNQSEQMSVEILGLELLRIADLETLVQKLEEMSFASDDDDDENDSYANDSLRLGKVTAGARRRTQRRRNSADSYANDSIDMAKKIKESVSMKVSDTKDRLPCEMVFVPQNNEASECQAKDLTSMHLAAKDLSKLKPHSLTNRAA